MQLMTPAGDRLRELGKLVKRRREALKLPMDTAAQTAEVSRTTWSNLEKGLPVRGLSYAAIEQVLGYESGSFDEFLSSGTLPILKNGRSGSKLEEVERTIALLQDPGTDWFDPITREYFLKRMLEVRDRLRNPPNSGEQELA